jgi:hypothetical protein
VIERVAVDGLEALVGELQGVPVSPEDIYFVTGQEVDPYGEHSVVVESGHLLTRAGTQAQDALRRQDLWTRREALDEARSPPVGPGGEIPLDDRQLGHLLVLVLLVWRWLRRNKVVPATVSQSPISGGGAML